MTNKFDNNETLAFQEEEANLSRVENLLDGLISKEQEKVDEYLDRAASSQTVEDKHMFEDIATSAKERAREYNEIKPEPYHGRIDVSRDDGEVQTFFIGYNPLVAPRKTEILSWRSPLGMTFSQKSKKEFDVNGYHYTLYLRRAIKIEDEKLQMVNTEYDVDSVSLDGDVIDPFLLSVLRDKRRNHILTDIVRTIQENQNDIIAKPIGESFVVQGCAGSGKTMILLHRLSYLAYNNPKSDFSKWCILTPNEYFNVHIQELSETLDIAEIKRFTVEEYYGELMRYLLPVDETKKNKIDVVVQSEKTLDCGMLTEIYSIELRDQVVSTYNEIWENCLSVLEEKGFLSIVGEFSALAPNMKFKLPDLTIYKFSTYGVLSSLLHTIRNKIIDESSRYDKAQEDLASLQTEMDKTRSALSRAEAEVAQAKETAIEDIVEEIKKAELETSNHESAVVSLQNETVELESKQGELKNKIGDQEASVSTSAKTASEMAKYEYIANNDNALTALVKNECSVEFGAVVSLETELSRIPIYNFGKRNKVKAALLDAKNKFAARAIEVINVSKASISRDIEILKQQFDEFSSRLAAIKLEIEEHKQQIKKIQDRIYVYRMCKDVINGHDPINARKLLQDSKLNAVRDLYIGYLAAINKLIEAQKAQTIQSQTLETLNKIVNETKACASKRQIVSTIEEMQDTIESIRYKNVKNELNKLLERVYKKYGYKRRASENYRHRLYYKLLMAALYYSGTGSIHNFINIDEAQDIAVTEYDLFKSVLGEKCIFNLYGDVNQLIYDYKGVSEWEDIAPIVHDRIYLLNENYRNTIQITEYCNSVFGAEVTAIGLKGNEVQESDLPTAISRMLEECEESIDSRFGIIYKRGVAGFKDTIESMINPELISWDAVDPGRISVIPIEMAKGLEFESVIVISNFMSENEKYIAFTRALESLYVAESVNAKLIKSNNEEGDDADIINEADDYDEIDEAELFEMFAVEIEEVTASEDVHDDEEFVFDEGAPLISLPSAAQKLPFKEGMPYIASFFNGNYDLAKKFLQLGIYLRRNNPNLQSRVSENYVGFANQSEYSMVYVSKHGERYSAKFRHTNLYFDMVKTSDERLITECDKCLEFFKNNKDSVKLS